MDKPTQPQETEPLG